MTRFRGIRQALLETPYLPVAAYLGAVGIAALVAGHAILPDTLTEVLPAWLATIWTVAVAAGGILPVVGRVVNATRIESAGLAMLGFGAGLYGVCVAVAAWPYGLTALALAFAVGSMCGIRMRILSLARHAQHVAGDIIDAQDRNHGGDDGERAG